MQIQRTYSSLQHLTKRGNVKIVVVLGKAFQITYSILYMYPSWMLYVKESYLMAVQLYPLSWICSLLPTHSLLPTSTTAAMSITPTTAIQKQQQNNLNNSNNKNNNLNSNSSNSNNEKTKAIPGKAANQQQQNNISSSQQSKSSIKKKTETTTKTY